MIELTKEMQDSETSRTKLKDWGIKPLRNYLVEEGKLLQVRTVNSKTFSYIFLDYDGKDGDWFMGKMPDGTYRRVKRDSISNIYFLDFSAVLNPDD
ncbi:hypothetical protein [Bacillus toyonensis]|uniref:hypothetical protein n=1 Tax=Bacillus toyonensis TaxID=155322 RepID=UPI001C0D4501|nr:hypothetical protein [Bacillus toyonensis]MBU4643158.1 hypothetical protein [Bacillus toyonensis]